MRLRADEKYFQGEAELCVIRRKFCWYLLEDFEMSVCLRFALLHTCIALGSSYITIHPSSLAFTRIGIADSWISRPFIPGAIIAYMQGYLTIPLRLKRPFMHPQPKQSAIPSHS